MFYYGTIVNHILEEGNTSSILVDGVKRLTVDIPVLIKYADRTQDSLQRMVMMQIMIDKRLGVLEKESVVSKKKL